MNDNGDKRLRESRQTFRTEAAVGPLGRHAPVTTKPLCTKVFKSGNSLALRLPKALGLEEGIEMELSNLSDGSYLIRRMDLPRRKIDISGFAGKAPGIRLAPREDFEERPSTIAARKAAGPL